MEMIGRPHASVQPLIRTARLLLRPVRPADLDALHALWCEPEVCRFADQGGVPTRDQSRLRLARSLEQAVEGLGLWRLHRLADGAAIGCVSLLRGPRPGTLEPAAALHVQHRGQGYACEALAALLAHAADALGAFELVAHCSVPDVAGDRLLRRLGFVGCYECDAGRYRLRQYRPGVRSDDACVVTTLRASARLHKAPPARTACA